MSTLKGRWLARQSHFPDVKLEFTSSHVVRKSIFLLDAEDEELVSSQDGTNASPITEDADGSYEYRTRGDYLFRAPWFRYKWKGDQVPASGGVLRPVLYDSGFDGNVSRSLTSSAEFSYPSGNVVDDQRPSAAWLLETQPARWHYASGYPDLHEISFEAATIKSTQAAIGDVDCWLVEELDISGSQKKQYWISPTRGWGVVQYQYSIEGALSVEISCQYQENAGVWTLSGWNITRFDADQIPFAVIETKVDSTSLNVGLQQAAFTVQFPPGSVVTDQTKKILEDGRLRDRLYLVQPEGDEREILWSERNLTYRDIVSSKTGELIPIQANSSPLRRWLIAVNAVLMIVGIITLVIVGSRKRLSR